MKSCSYCCTNSFDNEYKYVPTYGNVLCILCLMEHESNIYDSISLVKTHCTKDSKYPLIIGTEYTTIEGINYINKTLKQLRKRFPNCTYKLFYKHRMN